MTEPRTDSLSHADVYAGLQAVIAILAALHSRKTAGQGQDIDVAMAAILLAVNERAHVDLSDDDIGPEPAVLGATDCSFFTGPQGEHFTVATSIVGSRTFLSWLRAMRRVDLNEDPRFSSAAARRLNFGALHQIIQSWMLTFPDMATPPVLLNEWQPLCCRLLFRNLAPLRSTISQMVGFFWGLASWASCCVGTNAARRTCCLG